MALGYAGVQICEKTLWELFTSLQRNVGVYMKMHMQNAFYKLFQFFSIPKQRY